MYIAIPNVLLATYIHYALEVIGTSLMYIGIYCTYKYSCVHNYYYSIIMFA